MASRMCWEVNGRRRRERERMEDSFVDEVGGWRNGDDTRDDGDVWRGGLDGVRVISVNEVR